MTVKFLKCSICGNIVGLIHDGGGELVCCGKPMQEIGRASCRERV